MFQAHSETMALSKGRIITFLIVQKTAAVLHVCNLSGILLNILIGTVVEVVASQVHISVKQIEGTVHSSHP